MTQGSQDERPLLGLFGAVLLTALLSWEGPTTGYWDTYIAAPAAHLTGRTFDFHLRDGSPAYRTELTGSLPDDLLDKTPGGFGVISEDQRLGAGVVAAPFFDALGVFGLRLAHAVAWASAALLIATTAIALGASTWAGVAGGAFAAWNPYSLSVNALNANVFALAALALLLRLVASRKDGGGVGRWVLGGALLGVLGGVRNECILLVPAIFFGVLACEKTAAARVRATLALGIAGIALLLPTLAWQKWAFGSWIIHASQYGGFEGFRPTFPHSLGPLSFEFNGLLNWPLHSELVRTPHFPYPTMALLPLVIVRSAGALGVALTLIGWLRLRRSHSAMAWVAVGWIVPMWAMLSVQENWEELKMTYLVLLMPPVGLTMAFGIDEVHRGLRERRTWIKLVATTVAVFLAALAIAQVDAPLDDRWYVRFPHARGNEAGLTPLPHEKRWAWEFFHSAESAEEIARERARLSPPRIFPAPYRDNSLTSSAPASQLASEIGRHDVRTLAIWKYIYTVAHKPSGPPAEH